MSLAKAAQVLNAPLTGVDRTFSGVSTDTRTLSPGDLFVALQGPNHDGHHFIAAAAQAGAVGVLSSRSTQTALPSIKVPDTLSALGTLAAAWRRRFDIPVIAITGSNGKTTVKEMTATIMAETGRGCTTRGNLNNEIGVPLTLLRLNPADRYAVIELGMNHRGEIEYLSRLSQPTIAAITNAAEAHLEGVGSLEDVARAKGEIFSSLAETGVAVINADDKYADFWRDLASPRRCLTFGLDSDADITADYQADTTGSLVRIQTTYGDIDMRLPLLGKHNVSNALAATASSIAAGAELNHVERGLEKLWRISGRLEIKPGLHGSRVIDDTYNANPASLTAGIAVLKEFPGDAVLVIGDMAELGSAAPDIHRRVGQLAKRLGISRLFAIGALSKLAVDSFGEGGMHFSSRRELVEALLHHLNADTTVLVKGSRVMRLEHVVQKITQTDIPDTREANAN